jgi:CheY-like chemotaxis protein
MDVMLPSINDWALLGQLRVHPALLGVPIIVCTILPQEDLALALGAAVYLRKPINREVLLSMLDQLIHRASKEH